MAKIKNPRKKFLWQITFINHPINPYLFMKVNVPEKSIEQVDHADVNRDVKTAGRVKIGNMTAEKLETTSGSDTWLWDWMQSIQDTKLGGGLRPDQYWETVKVDELAEDGISILNTWLLEEVWPMKVNGHECERKSSDNTIENIEFSVGDMDKL